MTCGNVEGGERKGDWETVKKKGEGGSKKSNKVRGRERDAHKG